jgi:hypothetical protein
MVRCYEDKYTHPSLFVGVSFQEPLEKESPRIIDRRNIVAEAASRPPPFFNPLNIMLEDLCKF